MSDSPQTESNPQNTQADKKSYPRRYLRRIIIYSVIAYLILLGLSFFWPNLAERTKFFTSNALVLALLIVAIVQVLIYYRQQVIMHKQWEAMNTQAATMQEQLGVMREAQKSFAVGERAYLTVKEVVFIEKGERPQVLYTLFNGGRTPAFDVSGDTDVTIGAEPRTDEIESLGHPYGEKACIPAGTEKHVVGSFPNTVINAAHWQAIEAGTSTFFARGVFYYKDFHGVQHNLRFCVGYDPRLNVFREYKAENYSKNPN